MKKEDIILTISALAFLLLLYMVLKPILGWGNIYATWYE